MTDARTQQHLARYRRVAGILERTPVGQRERRRECLDTMNRILARSRFDAAKKGTTP